MPKSYGFNTPFVVSLIYDLNKIRSLFIKLKERAKRYPLKINLKNRKILISFCLSFALKRALRLLFRVSRL